MHTVFTILISIITLTRKQTDFNQADFYERTLLSSLYSYKVTTKFQDHGSSITKAKQSWENLIHDGKKTFAVLRWRCQRGLKNTQKLSRTICKIIRSFLTLPPLTALCGRHKRMTPYLKIKLLRIEHIILDFNWALFVQGLLKNMTTHYDSLPRSFCFPRIFHTLITNGRRGSVWKYLIQAKYKIESLTYLLTYLMSRFLSGNFTSRKSHGFVE